MIVGTVERQSCRVGRNMYVVGDVERKQQTILWIAVEMQEAIERLFLLLNVDSVEMVG